MGKNIYTIITGTGSFIPPSKVKNDDFLDNEFYDAQGNKLKKTNKEIIDKFKEITTISERRHVSDELLTSDIAYFAAIDAIKSANINKEDLDYIIFAHNFGDISTANKQLNIVPSLAARVKFRLQIENPNTIAYDLIFGCPGWVQSVISADYFIKSGDAKKILVIGADIISRVSDPHDIDSMLYADGAGAVVLEAKQSDEPIGILAHKTRSDTLIYSKMLFMGESYNAENNTGNFYLKMNGRKLYQYALETVPQLIKDTLKKADLHLSDINKVLIHQANGKMDDAILKRLFKLYDFKDVPDNIMPMTIAQLGNSSVATIPTLLNLLLNNKIESYKINKNENLVFASVGAGMNINAFIYKV